MSNFANFSLHDEHDNVVSVAMQHLGTFRRISFGLLSSGISESGVVVWRIRNPFLPGVFSLDSDDDVTKDELRHSTLEFDAEADQAK